MFWPFKKQKRATTGMELFETNKPVENPKLRAAMDAYLKSKNLSTETDLGLQLNSAIFLVVIISDEMHTTPVDLKGHTTITKGSLLKFPYCYSKENDPFLPVFTDWKEIRYWTDQNVSAIVMPAKELWDFALGIENTFGVVINPGTQGWEMRKENLQALKSDITT
jgi:hypothetical protein